LSIEKSISSLFARTAHGIKPGLGSITSLLEQLGNPQDTLKVIHVAGTNGKGSVCAMIESVLRASGFKTGLYTSPHLFRFNERFRINGKDIPDSDLEKLIAAVEGAEQRRMKAYEGSRESFLSEGCPEGGEGRLATFFEISTAMAFEYFRREQVDYAVIETGMGGRWDATNVVHPILSILTRIDLDHAEYLGNDLAKIAGEKAGIIKEGVPVICGPMPVEAEAVIYEEAAQKKAPILGSEEAVFFQTLESRRTDHLIDIEASGHQYHAVRLPLGGNFQLENCGIAVTALEDLSDIEDLCLQMKKGLETVQWAGRFQMLSMRPPMIFDGAHNPNAARVLFQTIEDFFPRFENGFIFGFMKDKNVKEMLAVYAPVVQKAWGFTLPGKRAMSAEEIVEIGNSIGLNIEPIESLESSREWVQNGKKRLLCLTGSLSLGEALKKSGFPI